MNRVARPWLVLLWLSCALASLLGCRAVEPVPQLLNLLDAGPRQLTAGDTFEITGSGFPAQRSAREKPGRPDGHGTGL